MKSDSLGYQTLKNISYSSLGFFVAFFVTIFVTPFVVFKLGLENYGVYIFLMTISSVLGVIDFGSSVATMKFLSEYIGQNDTVSIRRIIGSMNTVYFITGIVGFLLITFFGYFFGNFYSSSHIPFVYFLLIGALFFITSSSGVIYLLPTAYLRFDINFKIGTFKLILSNILFIGILLFGGNLLNFILSILFVELLFVFIFRFFAKKLTGLNGWFYNFEKNEIVKIYKFGVVYFVYNFSNQILTFFDKILIPFYTSNLQLSYYSLPGNISNKIQGLSNSFSAILLPTSSNLMGNADFVRIKSLYSKSLRLLFVFVFAISSVVFIFSFELLKNWLSVDVASNSYVVLKISVFTYFLLSLFGVINNYLTGLNKIKILSIVYLIMALFSVALLFILLPRFGIAGAAWAYLIGILPGLYLFYYIEKIVLSFSTQERLFFYVKIFIKNLICSILVYLLYLLIFKHFLYNLFLTLFFCGLSLVIYLGLFYLFRFFENEDLVLIKSFISSAFLNKFKKESTI